MSDEIRFEALPPGKRGQETLSYADIAAKLAARPGEWGVVCRRQKSRQAATQAYSMRQGHGIGPYIPEGMAVETAARTVFVSGEPEHRVYARFVRKGA